MLKLSPDEFQILGLMAEGKRDNAISAELGVKPGALRVRVTRICDKLDAKTRTQAVAMYVEAKAEVIPAFLRPKGYLG